MRHHNSVRKFGRVRKVRVALMKSLAYSLAVNGKIKTTETKAKELRPYMEKLVTAGKSESLASKRALISKIGAIGAGKIVKDIAPKYKNRAGGYTRITKLPRRLSDGSFEAVIEFV